MIRERHHHILGLPAAQIAEVLAMAESRLVDALVEPAFPAEGAVPARREEARHDAIPGLESLDLGPHILHHADELVTQDGALVDRRVAVEDVQVGPADGAERDLDEGLACALDARLGHVGHLDYAFGLKGQRLHGRILGSLGPPKLRTCD